MRTVTRLGLLGALVVLGSAHVGSPDTWFEGNAGPYPVRVVVRQPGVVPGLAQIDIKVTGDGVTKVTAQPVIFDAGKEGAPPPDDAKPVPGLAGSYHAQLWFMTPGSFSVNVTVEGARGSGTAVVPVTAVPVRQIPLYRWLGTILLALGTFLFVGAVTIFRAASGESVTEPGQPLSTRQKRTRLITTTAGTGLLALLLFGGKSWWNAVERQYLTNLYKPFPAKAVIDTTGGQRRIVFEITDSIWQAQAQPAAGGTRRRARQSRNYYQRFQAAPLMPDHGKLMHLFMVRVGDQGALAHLHPVSTDSSHFEAPVGDLPAGRYRVYADIVHETGFPQTMVAEVEVPAAPAGGALGDADDAVFVGPASDGKATLPDGATIEWTGHQAHTFADQDAGLQFTVKNADGTIASLEPFLGMAGHIVVEREDGGVYVHLHPSGTVSMAAQLALVARQEDSSRAGFHTRLAAAEATAHHSGPAAFSGSLSFPYAFPSPGSYRVWVQVRHGERIETAAFHVAVE